MSALSEVLAVLESISRLESYFRSDMATREWVVNSMARLRSLGDRWSMDVPPRQRVTCRQWYDRVQLYVADMDAPLQDAICEIKLTPAEASELAYVLVHYAFRTDEAIDAAGGPSFLRFIAEKAEKEKEKKG